MKWIYLAVTPAGTLIPVNATMPTIALTTDQFLIFYV
jgi:hypothetical protein